MILIILGVPLFACSNVKFEQESYHYNEKTNVQIDDRSFKLEDVPESIAEETVSNDYLYTITAEFDKESEIFADTEAFSICINNEKKLFEEGRYIQSYQIHHISTLTKEEYSQEKLADGKDNPLYDYGWEESIKKFSLTEFQIIDVDFTQTLSAKAMEGGPQWGSGRYQRWYLVGKTDQDSAYKIYDLGWMRSSS